MVTKDGPTGLSVGFLIDGFEWLDPLEGRRKASRRLEARRDAVFRLHLGAAQRVAFKIAGLSDLSSTLIVNLSPALRSSRVADLPLSVTVLVVVMFQT